MPRANELRSSVRRRNTYKIPKSMYDATTRQRDETTGTRKGSMSRLAVLICHKRRGEWARPNNHTLVQQSEHHIDGKESCVLLNEQHGYAW